MYLNENQNTEFKREYVDEIRKTVYLRHGAFFVSATETVVLRIIKKQMVTNTNRFAVLIKS